MKLPKQLQRCWSSIKYASHIHSPQTQYILPSLMATIVVNFFSHKLLLLTILCYSIAYLLSPPLLHYDSRHHGQNLKYLVFPIILVNMIWRGQIHRFVGSYNWFNWYKCYKVILYKRWLQIHIKYKDSPHSIWYIYWTIITITGHRDNL